MPKDERKFWHGSEITNCQVCTEPIKDAFIDGATPMGWAILCEDCHKTHGRGIGTGLGQRYLRMDDGRWLKDVPKESKPKTEKEPPNPLVRLQKKLKTDNRSVEF